MTGARPDTWMPLYWGDYLRDTGHLSTAEHGAYFLLIGHYWTTGKPLSDDDDQLRRIAKMSPREWDAARRVIAPLFIVADDLWRHKRVDNELERCARVYFERSQAGSKGGSKAQANRKQNSSGASSNGEAKSNYLQLPSQSPSNEGLSARGAQGLKNGLAGSQESVEVPLDSNELAAMYRKRRAEKIKAGDPKAGTSFYLPKHELLRMVNENLLTADDLKRVGLSAI